MFSFNGPMSFHSRLTRCVVPLVLLVGRAVNASPNIVVIMSDDQDYRLDSLSAQPAVNELVIDQGLLLDNHFVTVAQCCPSRTSFLRGQHGHNTNMTHVAPPGGGYDKFLATREDHDYLPHWLNAAGYNTEYIGKFMNGLNLATYTQPPKGWSHVDALVGPYTYEFNNVVMSANGDRPVFYEGYHQTDVIRAKALSRLEHLTGQDKPFYLQIAPASPHSSMDGPTVPLVRHMYEFISALAPRLPNFNPADAFQKQKPSYLRDYPPMNDSVVNYVDWQHRSRLQGLKGVDEIVEDVVKMLEEKGVLEDTYVIYTTDNGFHCGNHRVIGGKGLPYIEDTNIPMAIRGPGIQQGKSLTPSTHVDMAPTFLDIAGVPRSEWPVFFDGRSLLPEWLGSDSNDPNDSSYVAKEILNVEFWGSIGNSGPPDFNIRQDNNSYKTVRIVGEESAWLFSRWCTGNDTELYNTIDDPYELTNLALNPDQETQRLINRLNGVLLVTKSCSQGSCRNPWALFPIDGSISNLEQAMDPKFDNFFDSLPEVGFQMCMDYQDTTNEMPYYPESASNGLGTAFRNATDNFLGTSTNYTLTSGSAGRMGTAAQRHTKLEEMESYTRELTDKEIGPLIYCGPPEYGALCGL